MCAKDNYKILVKSLERPLLCVQICLQMSLVVMSFKRKLETITSSVWEWFIQDKGYINMGATQPWSIKSDRIQYQCAEAGPAHPCLESSPSYSDTETIPNQARLHLWGETHNRTMKDQLARRGWAGLNRDQPWPPPPYHHRVGVTATSSSSLTQPFTPAAATPPGWLPLILKSQTPKVLYLPPRVFSSSNSLMAFT